MLLGAEIKKRSCFVVLKSFSGRKFVTFGFFLFRFLIGRFVEETVIIKIWLKINLCECVHKAAFRFCCSENCFICIL